MPVFFDSLRKNDNSICFASYFLTFHCYWANSCKDSYYGFNDTGRHGWTGSVPRLLEIDPQVKGVVSRDYSKDPVMAQYKKYGFAGMVYKPFEID